MNYRRLIIFSPILLFLLIWLSVIGLHYGYNPYKYIRMSEYSQFLVIISIVFLSMGYLLYNSESNGISQLQQQIVKVNERYLSIFIVAVSIFIWIGIIINIQSLGKELGGLKEYLINPFKVRGKIVDLTESNIENYNLLYSVSNYITSLNYPLTVLGGILFAIKGKFRILGLLPILQGMTISLITLGRFSAMTTLGFWFLATYYYSFYHDKVTTKKLLKNTLFYGLFLITILFLFFFIIVRLRTFYLKNINTLFVKSIYTYFVGPVSAFEGFISTDVKYMYGESAFRSIFKWLGRFGLWDAQSVLRTNNPFVSIGSWTSINTFSYVKTFYEDFGILGVITGSIAWGWAIRFITERALINFNMKKFYLLIIGTFSLIMSFYAFYFEGLTAIILYYIYMIIFDRILIKYKCYVVQ
jgi:oligosaccharide repeat unit polymerase